jgi:hypothetical protein
MDYPNCPRCVGNGCQGCDYTGVLHGDDVLPIAPYPAPYDAAKQLMTDWTLAYPIERPEMLIWGSSLVVAAFMVAAPRVVAGFGSFGVTDEEYLRAEERFQNAAYKFDHATTCSQMRSAIKSMSRALRASLSVELGYQYRMRLDAFTDQCSTGE